MPRVETDCWIHAMRLETVELAGGGPPLGWSKACEPEEEALVGLSTYVVVLCTRVVLAKSRGNQNEVATLLS